MTKKPKIVVVGSFFMDLVFRVSRRPGRGETLIGQEFGLFTGGKGYNQAIAAARMGADVTMIGRLGADSFGDMFITSLQKEGINISHVGRDEIVGTGVANPVIYESEHDNSIIIVPRANHQLAIDHIEAAASLIQASNLLMLQLEIEISTSLRAAQIAHEVGVPVLLNPAPAQAIPAELLKLTNIIIPNEVEAVQLVDSDKNNPIQLTEIAQYLHNMGPERVVITLGERGAFMLGPEGESLLPAYKICVVDPTAAGDAFCGAFAVALAEGRSPTEAVCFGNAAGALATTILGAEPSLPTRERVEALIWANS